MIREIAKRRLVNPKIAVGKDPQNAFLPSSCEMINERNESENESRAFERLLHDAAQSHTAAF